MTDFIGWSKILDHRAVAKVKEIEIQTEGAGEGLSEEAGEGIPVLTRKIHGTLLGLYNI